LKSANKFNTNKQELKKEENNLIKNQSTKKFFSSPTKPELKKPPLESEDAIVKTVPALVKIDLNLDNLKNYIEEL
jgi:hypothetical protein